MRMDRTCRGSVIGAVPEQVAPRPEAIEDPVEVALAQAIQISRLNARGPMVLVADRRRIGDPEGPPRTSTLAAVAQHQAPPDVEIAVQPKALIEEAALDQVGAPKGQGKALDRVDIARRSILEAAHVIRDEAPTSGDRDTRVVERPDERTDQVADGLDARVEQDDDGGNGPTHPRVGGRRVAEPLTRPHHLGLELADRPARRAVVGKQRRFLLGVRMIGDDHNLGRVGCMRSKARHGSGEVDRLIDRDQDHGGERAGRLAEPGRHGGTAAVERSAGLDDIRGMGWFEAEMAAAIDDPPAGRLDLVPKLPLPPLYDHVLGLYEVNSIQLGIPPKILIKPELACLHILTSYLYLLSKQATGAVLPLIPQCVP